ncbi:hypothetical protein BE04_51065 [Sorangium cellulosum]|uniref:Uncharacterized protein n=1 Tax=Sorangium cellulosum TaxID=56 RepID=A0A150P2P2_SORCE|nr:hypothetical protein BE04_51065 [Sorangium cellulosum]
MPGMAGMFGMGAVRATCRMLTWSAELHEPYQVGHEGCSESASTAVRGDGRRPAAVEHPRAHAAARD